MHFKRPGLRVDVKKCPLNLKCNFNVCTSFCNNSNSPASNFIFTDRSKACCGSIYVLEPNFCVVTTEVNWNQTIGFIKREWE